MKKKYIPKLTAGFTAGMMIGAAALMPGCGNANTNGTTDPSVITETPTATPTPTPKSTRVTAPTVSPTPRVTATPALTPEANIPEPVYGPPEDYVYVEAPVEPEYDPEANVSEDVYGPPEYFDEAYEDDADMYIYGYFDEETGEYIEYTDGYYHFDQESEEWIFVAYGEEDYLPAEEEYYDADSEEYYDDAGEYDGEIDVYYEPDENVEAALYGPPEEDEYPGE